MGPLPVFNSISNIFQLLMVLEKNFPPSFFPFPKLECTLAARIEPSNKKKKSRGPAEHSLAQSQKRKVI